MGAGNPAPARAHGGIGWWVILPTALAAGVTAALSPALRPWVFAGVLALAGGMTLGTLLIRFHPQNVLALLLAVAGLSGLGVVIEAYLGSSGVLPTGPSIAATAGSWFVFLMASRETARGLIRHWRERRHYGFILLGVTAGLTTLLKASLENTFTVAQILAWISGAALALVAVTPWLVKNQRPGAPEVPWAIQSWIMLGFFFAVSGFAHGRITSGATTAAVTAAMVLGLGQGGKGPESEV